MSQYGEPQRAKMIVLNYSDEDASALVSCPCGHNFITSLPDENVWYNQTGQAFARCPECLCIQGASDGV